VSPRPVPAAGSQEGGSMQSPSRSCQCQEQLGDWQWDTSWWGGCHHGPASIGKGPKKPTSKRPSPQVSPACGSSFS
jgi:hypothetical protein